MKEKHIIMFFITIFSVFFLASCEKEEKIVSYTLVAKEGKINLGKGELNVFTFNGKTPGPVIHVKEGQTLKVTLKNELSVPTTLHWHGLNVPNDEDGVAGVTQNAVQPGKSYTYEFKVNQSGTFWYHSHQNSSVQVDKGLLGAIVVEPKKEKVKYDRDYTLVLDEWIADKSMYDMMLGKNQMDMSMGMNMGSGTGHSHNMSVWDTFTINGQLPSKLKPFAVKDGDLVKLRFINAGNMPHSLYMRGTKFKVVSADGNDINKPQGVKDGILEIGPGERYDVSFVYQENKKIYIERVPDMSINTEAKIYFGKKVNTDDSNAVPTKIEITKYGEKIKSEFSESDNFDVVYKMTLGDRNGTVFTINGKTFDEGFDPIKVKKGDKVKVAITNPTQNIHPMHLHGHTFQILKKNGVVPTGSPIKKDTVLLLPGDTYEIAFDADNEGIWMFHCHDLHHAASGMMTEVVYDGYKPNFTPDPSAGNIHE